MTSGKDMVLTDHIEGKILSIRGLRVMLDSDLAELYGVETRILSQAVKRNLDRFPEDFMFRLTAEEKQEVITICDNPDRIRFSPTTPRVFSEHGALMLANVLNSKRAVSASINIVRAFMKMREVFLTRADILKKFTEIEAKLTGHDEKFKILEELLLPLLEIAGSSKRKIGFRPEERKD